MKSIFYLCVGRSVIRVSKREFIDALKNQIEKMTRIDENHFAELRTRSDFFEDSLITEYYLDLIS